MSSQKEIAKMRLRGSDSMSEVMERIVDGGIVVDPWSNIRSREPERQHRYRWVAECSVIEHACDRKKVA